MEVIKTIGNQSGYDFYLKEDNKILKIVFGGNLDLYWNLILSNEYGKYDEIKEMARKNLENLKLRIENERLKKGYLVKGVGANKEFVTISDANMK